MEDPLFVFVLPCTVLLGAAVAALVLRYASRLRVGHGGSASVGQHATRAPSPEARVLRVLAAFVLSMTSVANALFCSSLFSAAPRTFGLLATPLLLVALVVALRGTRRATPLLLAAAASMVVLQLVRRGDYARQRRHAETRLAEYKLMVERCCADETQRCQALPLACKDPWRELGNEGLILDADWLTSASGWVIIGSVTGAAILLIARRI